MSEPASTPTRTGPLSRIDRAWQPLLPILICAALIAFVGVSSYQWIRYAPPGDRPLVVRIGLSLFFLAGPLWVLTRRLRTFPKHQPRSLTSSVALAASFAVFLAWLAHDDEEWRHSERHPSLRNDFPEAATTHALTLRYTKDTPGSLFSSLPEPGLDFPATSPSSKNDAEWTAFVAENGPAIDALWIEVAPLRAWIDEIAVAPAIGDFADDFGSPVIGLKAVSLASHLASSRALQLAAAGRRDEAVETLLPILAVAQKLEPHARTLMRRLITLSLRRQVQSTLGRVLDTGALSPMARERLAAALAPRQDLAEQARLLPRCEYEMLARFLVKLNVDSIAALSPKDDPNRRWIAPMLRPLLPFIYNPRQTANLAGDLSVKIGEACARRDLSALTADRLRFTGNGALLPGKNYVGRLILTMVIPSFDRITESYWEAEDQRAALLTRLTN
jgi:hypothetical protein